MEFFWRAVSLPARLHFSYEDAVDNWSIYEIPAARSYLDLAVLFSLGYGQFPSLICRFFPLVGFLRFAVE